MLIVTAHRKGFYSLAIGFALLVLNGNALAMPSQVILLRHADKDDTNRGNYNLSPAGFERALRLGQMIPACLGTPTQIRSYDMDPISGKNARSYQTAVPLAVATGVNIGIVVGSRDNSARFGEEVLQSAAFDGARAVFVWEHRKLPELAKALGWPGMQPIEDNDYDKLYRLTYKPGSRQPNVEQFSQQELFQRPCSPLTAVSAPTAKTNPKAASSPTPGIEQGLQHNLAALEKELQRLRQVPVSRLPLNDGEWNRKTPDR